MKLFKITFIFVLSLAFFSSCNQDTEILEDIEETIELDEQDDALESRGRNAWMYFNGGEVINRVYKSGSADNVTWSGNAQINNGGELTGGCAATMFNGQAFVFYERAGSDGQIFFSKSSDGQNWTEEQSIGENEKTDLTPSATSFRGRLFVAYRQKNYSPKDKKGSIVIVASGDGINWSGGMLAETNSSFVPPPVTEASPAIATDGNFLYLIITYKNDLYPNLANEIVVYRSSTGQTWDYLGSMEDQSKNGPSAVFFNGRMRVAFNGKTSKKVFVKEFLDNSGNLIVGERITVLGAKTSQGPSITASPNELLLIYKGNNTNNIYRAVSTNGITYSGNNTVPGKTKRRPAVIFSGF